MWPCSTNWIIGPNRVAMCSWLTWVRRRSSPPTSCHTAWKSASSGEPLRPSVPLISTEPGWSVKGFTRRSASSSDQASRVRRCSSSRRTSSWIGASALRPVTRAASVAALSAASRAPPSTAAAQPAAVKRPGMAWSIGRPERRTRTVAEIRNAGRGPAGHRLHPRIARELEESEGRRLAFRRDLPRLGQELLVLRREIRRRTGKHPGMPGQRLERRIASRPLGEPARDEPRLPRRAALQDRERPERIIEPQRATLRRERLADRLPEHPGQQGVDRGSIACPGRRSGAEAPESLGKAERRPGRALLDRGNRGGHRVELIRRRSGRGLPRPYHVLDGWHSGKQPRGVAPLGPPCPGGEGGQKQEDREKAPADPALGPGRRSRLHRFLAVPQEAREIAPRRPRRLGRGPPPGEELHVRLRHARQRPPARLGPAPRRERRIAERTDLENREKGVARFADGVTRGAGAERRRLELLCPAPGLGGERGGVGIGRSRRLGRQREHGSGEPREDVVAPGSVRRPRPPDDGAGTVRPGHHMRPSAAHWRSSASPTSKCIESSRP